jgi:adenylate kinase
MPPKFILFTGPPGSGLGTFSLLLCKSLSFTRIAISEEISKLLNETSTLNLPKNSALESLGNSPRSLSLKNDLAIRIIQEKLKEKNSENGVTISGFPRNLSQMEVYEGNFPITLGISLNSDEDIIMERLLGRRVCSGCGAVYNLCETHRRGYELKSLLPKIENKCDFCGGRLHIRKDDNVETIYSRIYNYRKDGGQLLDYLKRKYSVVEFEPKRGVRDFEEFFEIVKKRLI